MHADNRDCAFQLSHSVSSITHCHWKEAKRIDETKCPPQQINRRSPYDEKGHPIAKKRIIKSFENVPVSHDICGNF